MRLYGYAWVSVREHGYKKPHAQGTWDLAEHGARLKEIAKALASFTFREAAGIDLPDPMGTYNKGPGDSSSGVTSARKISWTGAVANLRIPAFVHTGETGARACHPPNGTYIGPESISVIWGIALNLRRR